jgi:hypothetical protein
VGRLGHEMHFVLDASHRSSAAPEIKRSTPSGFVESSQGEYRSTIVHKKPPTHGGGRRKLRSGAKESCV